MSETERSSEIPSNESPSGKSLPDANPSDESPSDESLSDESLSDESLSDESLSDESLSDESASDESASDESLADESPSGEAPLISGKPSPLIVRLILFAALALLVAGAAYEYLYARGQSEGAFRKLKELDERKTDLAEPLYDEDVRELIGFEPERKKIDHLTEIEYYRWQSVVPNRQYFVWVLYRLTYDNRWQCDAYGANKEPEPDKHSPIGIGGPAVPPPEGKMPPGGLPQPAPGNSPPIGPLPPEGGS